MSRAAAFHGMACPTGGEAHGPLLPPREPGGLFCCPHEDHTRLIWGDHRVVTDEDRARQRCTWTLDELQAAGVAP